MKGLQQIANILVIIGALNWGLVGLVNYNFVESLLGGLGLVQIVYILVGLSGVLMLVNWGKK
jgi:uncharacterized protein